MMDFIHTLSRSIGYITECSFFTCQSLVSILAQGLEMHTAIPANAPAAMLAASEKLGGSPS
jgi:hypothetical protein